MAIRGNDYPVKFDMDIHMIMTENVRPNLETYRVLAVSKNVEHIPDLKAFN